MEAGCGSHRSRYGTAGREFVNHAKKAGGSGEIGVYVCSARGSWVGRWGWGGLHVGVQIGKKVVGDHAELAGGGGELGGGQRQQAAPGNLGSQPHPRGGARECFAHLHAYFLSSNDPKLGNCSAGHAWWKTLAKALLKSENFHLLESSD